MKTPLFKQRSERFAYTNYAIIVTAASQITHEYSRQLAEREREIGTQPNELQDANFDMDYWNLYREHDILQNPSLSVLHFAGELVQLHAIYARTTSRCSQIRPYAYVRLHLGIASSPAACFACSKSQKLLLQESATSLQTNGGC
jgi:hypothetical protein